MKAIQLFPDGSYDMVEVSRDLLLDQYPIYQRDLRPIVLIKQSPTIFERGGVIVMNLGFVRMLIAKEHAYVFNVSHRFVANQFIEDVQERLKTSAKEEGTPFEFTLIESALHVKIDKLSSDFSAVEKQVMAALEKLRVKQSEENFEALLLAKNRLSKLETSVKQIEELLNDVVDDEDKLRSFNISGRTSKQKEVLIESIFEHYYEQVDDLWNSIDDIDENIEDNQSIITLKLSNIRNTIIQFDLVISIITAAFGIPAIIVGLFGMNVINFNEKSEQAFIMIITGILLSLIFVVAFSLWLMKRKRIL